MMGLFWIEQEFDLATNHLHDLIIILSTMAAADLSSYSQGKHKSGFARELNVPTLVKHLFHDA
jgi:hypothetical protein